jgi:hypothetical protein
LVTMPFESMVERRVAGGLGNVGVAAAISH